MDLFWLILIIVLASVLGPIFICLIVYVVVFVFIKKASDAHKRNKTPTPYVITQTVQPASYPTQSTAPAFSNTAFIIDMNNQQQNHQQIHQDHQQIHQDHHQRHMDDHQKNIDNQNTVAISQTTEVQPSAPIFQAAFSAPGFNLSGGIKIDTGSTTNNPV